MKTRLAVAVMTLYGVARAAPPEVQTFASASDAMKELLTTHPRVIGFGEYHQKVGASTLPSSLKRFTDEILATVSAATSDLVVETWVNEGHCGASEKVVVSDVQKTTERPQVTESEVVTLLKRAKAAGVQPHILTMKCAEYDSLQGKDGVDYGKMLGLIGGHLHDEITRALARPSPDGKMVISYGGALHNDLFPIPGLEEYAFGQAVQKEVDGRYLEIDLFVPEYIEHDPLITKERWYPAYRKHARPGKVSLVKRGQSSYVLLFARAR